MRGRSVIGREGCWSSEAWFRAQVFDNEVQWSGLKGQNGDQGRSGPRRAAGIGRNSAWIPAWEGRRRVRRSCNPSKPRKKARVTARGLGWRPPHRGASAKPGVQVADKAWELGAGAREGVSSMRGLRHTTNQLLAARAIAREGVSSMRGLRHPRTGEPERHRDAREGVSSMRGLRLMTASCMLNLVASPRGRFLDEGIETHSMRPCEV